ncbi:MAG: hypothetical protein OEW45_21790, partial [Deltaproteobacteria bacterium]|nr:hypothetical protein [Deltaproteobacteria bacterium]
WDPPPFGHADISIKKAGNFLPNLRSIGLFRGYLKVAAASTAATFCSLWPAYFGHNPLDLK